MKDQKMLYRKKERRGAALLIVLAFIVLLTGLLVAYLSLSRADRQLANSSFNGSKVDQMAVSALEVTVGDLKQEIANGSTASTISKETIYVPTVNANMIPMRIGNPPITSGVDPIPNLVRISTHADASPTAPLVSSRASNLASTTASANGRSISPARWNQHYLIPRLSPGSATFDSTPINSFTPPDWVFVTREEGPDALATPVKDAKGNTVTPIGRYAYAIYDEGGTLDLNVAGFPSNTVATQEGGKGNIAYADLTALGLTQPQVDQIVGWRNYASAQPSGDFASSFVFNSTSAANYFNMVTNNGPLTGFMKVASTSTATAPVRTDQAFVSRQDLINFWSSQNLSPDILQYVGTFSRERNAPSWSPYYNASTLGGTSGTAYAYKSNADGTPVPTNPDLLHIRLSNTNITASGVTLTNYVLDGTSSAFQVFKGDPVVRRRFCLGRLKWLTSDGPSADIKTTNPNYSTLHNPGGTDAAIQQYFGLVWGTGPEKPNGLPCWVYTSPTGSISGGLSTQTSILSLNKVAGLFPPREPDFFELLKAGILNGSIGVDGGAVSSGSSAGPANDTQAWDQQSDFQIMQIGANIIAQATADNYPPEIYTNMTFTDTSGNVNQGIFYGIKNLPYLYGVYIAVVRDTNNFSRVVGLYVPQIWNPIQNNPASPSTSIPSSPSNFRITATGSSTFTIFNSNNAANVTPVPNPPAPPLSQDLSKDSGGNPQGIQFITNPIEPTLLLQSSGVTGLSADNSITSSAMSGQSPSVSSRGYIGIYAGSLTDPSSMDTPSSLTVYTNANLIPQGACFFLQYQDAGGNWRTYSQLKKLNVCTSVASFCDLVTGAGSNYYAVRSDPRADRFGLGEVYQGLGGAPGSGIPNRTLWPDAGIHSPETIVRWFSASPQFIYNGTGLQNSPPLNNWNEPWQLCENRPTPSGFGSGNGGTAEVYYTDLDGVYRRAVGAYAVVNSADGHPLATTAQTAYAPTFATTFPGTTGAMASRPVILNRPFRSVGELGYVFRDEPWKDLDFFTPESADSALLDLFTVDDGDVTAGRVSLNTRQAPVLQAILSGTIKNDLTPSNPVSSSDALTLAQAIVTTTTGGTTGVTAPFINRAELVNRFKSSVDTDPRSFIGSLTPLSFSATTDNTVKAQRESIVRALGDATTTRTWNLLIDVIAQTGHYPPGTNASTPLSQFVVDGERRYWLHVAIDRFTGQVVDRVLEPVYE